MVNRKKLEDAGFYQSIVFENPDYDDAIIGVSTQENVVYDFKKMVEHLQVSYDMSYEKAVDFIMSSTLRAAPYAGKRAPIIITMISDLEEVN